jgi:Protein of unknown function (DUF2845)
MDFSTIMAGMTHIYLLRTVAVSLVLAGTCLAVPAHAEDSMRCGSRLVSTGDGKDKVRTLCGEPSDITFQGVIRRAPRYEYGYGISRYEYYGPGVVEMPVEIWTYNQGSSKLLRKLRFVGDELDQITTDGYGY